MKIDRKLIIILINLVSFMYSNTCIKRHFFIEKSDAYNKSSAGIKNYAIKIRNERITELDKYSLKCYYDLDEKDPDKKAIDDLITKKDFVMGLIVNQDSRQKLTEKEILKRELKVTFTSIITNTVSPALVNSAESFYKIKIPKGTYKREVFLKNPEGYFEKHVEVTPNGQFNEENTIYVNLNKDWKITIDWTKKVREFNSTITLPNDEIVDSQNTKSKDGSVFFTLNDDLKQEEIQIKSDLKGIFKYSVNFYDPQSLSQSDVTVILYKGRTPIKIMQFNGNREMVSGANYWKVLDLDIENGTFIFVDEIIKKKNSFN